MLFLNKEFSKQTNQINIFYIKLFKKAVFLDNFSNFFSFNIKLGLNSSFIL